MSIEYEPITPPSLRLLFGELRTFGTLARMVGRRSRPQPAVDQQRAVLLLPGLGVSEWSMTAIARELHRRGHVAHDWGLGRNTGDVSRLLDQVETRAETLFDQAGEPLVLVGWSLGGYIAREVGRNRPELIAKVITLGSPAVGGPRFTRVVTWNRSRGWDLDAIEQQVKERFEIPLAVPVVAIYSKIDGIVAWQACLDPWSPDVRHREVKSTHLAMGFCPEVLDIIIEEVETASG